MRKMLWLLLLLVGLGGSASAQSYEKIQLYCEKGGETVTTDGRTSTTRVQRSYPSCTVTVYDGGTLTLASIASDSIGTPKSNPFTADSDGYISFYATDGTYDVKMSGSGLAAPITRSGFWVITSAGGGGGISGSGTTNRFPIFTSSSAIGNSVFQQVGTSEFAPAATGKRINLGTGSQQVVEIANAAVTGTTQNRLAKLTGAPSTAVIATTTDTTKLVGVVIAGAGTTGNAQIVTNGNVSCEFDGATTAGNYVGASTTTNGKCTDLGASLPVSGVQVIGRVLETIGSAGNATVFIFTGEQGRGGTTGSGTTAYLAYWTGTTALGATGVLYDTLNNIYQFAGDLDIANGGLSELTLETDQIIFKGGVIRANNAVMQTMKATATQTGDFQRFTTSAGSVRFRVDIDGDVLPRGVNYTWPATLPASTGCLQITSAGVMSVVSCVTGSVPFQVQAYNVKNDGGCIGDGVTNDTACVAAAYTAANAAGRPLYFPTGTYLIDASTIIIATNGLKIFGDGPGKTFLESRTGTAALIQVDATAVNPHSITITDLTLTGAGGGASNHGIHVYGSNTPFNMQFKNLRIDGFTGNGVYDTSGMFQSRIDNVVVSMDSTGGNGIDLLGSNDFILQNNYVTVVGNGGVAYRIHSGRPTFISNNGINPGITNGSWGVFGDILAEDGADRYVFATLIGNNIEDFTQYGMRFKEGSFGSFYGNTFLAPSTGTVTPLKFDFVDNGQRGLWDATNTISTLGASYTNGNALNSRGAPFTQIGGNDFTTYYDTNIAASVTFPYMSPQLVAGSTNIAMLTTRAQITALESSGLVGDFTGSTSFTGDAARILLQDGTAARPTYTFSGDTNTGFYRAGADSIGLAANGAVVGSFGTTGLTLGATSSVTGALNLANASSSFLTTITAGNAAASRTYVWPTDFGAAGTVLTDAAGNGVLSWATPTASASLTSTYVGYGNGSNVLTGTSDLAYSTSTKTLSIVNGSGASTLVLNGSSDTSAVKFGAASLPGTQGGIFFPFVGGGMSNGPGIWWGSSASYSSLSGIYLNNGFTFQGANSTHDPVKIAKSTGTSSTGTTIFEFRPSDAYFALSPFGTSTGETTPIRFLELAASGSDYVALKAPDALAAPITLTLPATLPASAGCLQVSSTGVITQTGSACGAGGGSVEWQAITNPTGNAALSMAAFTTSWTWNAATGASNLFTLTDTASNTGTGYIASISTAASSSAKPIRITAGGTANGVEMTTAGVLAAIGTGEIRATTANPSASIGLTANNGSATSAMRSDATPALSQAIAPTWTGLHTYNPGTTPSNVLLFDIAAIGSTGTRDSHNFVMRGRSDNGSAHTVEWKQFVDVTSNAGASQWVLQSNLDGGSFSNWLTIADSGLITGGNFLGANFTTAGGAVLDDDVNAVTGFTVNGVATNGTILRADGTRYAASSFTMAAPGTVGNVLTSDGTNWISSAPTGGGLGDPGANGIVARTALNTTTARTITGTANKITVTDGNGVSGNPTLTLPTLLNVDDVELSSGSAIATGTTNGNTFNLAAYDVDGATYTDLLRLTAGNTPAISFVLGSDATGDIWYRNSGGAITRLPVGSSGQVLTVSGGLPSWQDNIPVIAFSDLSSSIANVTFSQSTFNTTFNYTTGLQAASWSGNTSTSNAFSLSHSNTSATGSLLNLSTSASVSVRPLTISPRGNQSFQADHLGNIVIGNAALATSATDGFLYLPSSAGVPTGTPTSYTGRVPVEVDTTNSRLYGYIGSAWVNLTGSGGGGLGDPGANGVVVRTALDTTTARTITAGSSNGLSVTDGDGVSGNPTVDFSTTNTSGLGFHLPGNGGLPFVTDSSSALAGSANEVRVALFYAPGRITVDRIGVNGVTDSASNNAGFGIYSSDGNTKICDSGAISTTSWSGAASYTLSASCTFGPGYFYYAWTASSTTPTARSAAAITNFYAPLNTGSGTVLGTAANTSSAGVLPTTLGALTDSNSLAVPIVRWFKN